MYEINLHTKFSSTWFAGLTIVAFSFYLFCSVDSTKLRCPETLFISHEHANFLFSVFRVVLGEAKTPQIMGCCRAHFAFLPALNRGQKIFSVPVAEFFWPDTGTIFLVAFSLILVAIVRQASKS